jgi:hypothetical protein
MTHLKGISKCAPAGADSTQDVICIVVNTLNALLEAFGTSSPFGDFLRTKCEIPTPNP